MESMLAIFEHALLSICKTWGKAALMVSVHRMPGHIIRRLHQISTAIFTERMARIGEEITPVQFASLAAIRAHPGVDQATLAGLVAYDRVTIGGVVDRLVAKKLVERTVSPKDRRARVLTLTPEAEALMQTLEPKVEAFQTDILVGLTQSERETLIALMSKVVEAGNALSRAPQSGDDA